MKLTQSEQKIFDALRAAAESECDFGEKGLFASVYLDNVERGEMSERSFSGVCGSLARKGLYEREQDGESYFGYVKIEAGFWEKQQ